MLFKIIIVDDEEIIRDGLSSLIDWNSMGFEVVAQLEDGREAIEFINQMPVDIVLTDIKMTFVSGLDLARYIYENKPHIKIVILSGYKEFEFAKHAISYNVVHYLLKPTQMDELNNVFKDIKTQLDKERIGSKKMNEERQQYEELISFLQQQFFTDLIMGAIRNKEEIMKRLRIAKLEIKPENSKCCVLNIRMLDYDFYLERCWKYGKESFHTAIRNFLKGEEEGVRYFPVYYTHDSTRLLAVAPVEMDDISLRKAIEIHFERVRTGIKGILGMELSMDPDYSCKDLFGVGSDDSNTVFHGDDKDRDSKKIMDTRGYNGPIERQKLLMSYINAGNIESVSNLFDSYLDELRYMGISKVSNFVIDMFAILCNKLKDTGIDIYAVTQGRFNYDAILNMKNVEDMRVWGRRVLNDIVEHVDQYRETSQEHIIQNAKEYIRDHYCKDISLEDVADYVFLSAVYLSRFFKQHTGENFSDYLIKVRMQKAMDLLREPRYKAYEVCLLVGYKNAKYFSRLFRRYTGYTPSEYRQNLLAEGGKPYEK